MAYSVCKLICDDIKVLPAKDRIYGRIKRKIQFVLSREPSGEETVKVYPSKPARLRCVQTFLMAMQF